MPFHNWRGTSVRALWDNLWKCPLNFEVMHLFPTPHSSSIGGNPWPPCNNNSTRRIQPLFQVQSVIKSWRNCQILIYSWQIVYTSLELLSDMSSSVFCNFCILVLELANLFLYWQWTWSSCLLLRMLTTRRLIACQ